MKSISRISSKLVDYLREESPFIDVVRIELEYDFINRESECYS